jgi:hypothetical protein
MQLEFKCPECEVSGLTPDIPEDKTIAVALRQLRIRCPCCSAVVEVTDPLGRAVWKNPEGLAAALLEKTVGDLFSLIRDDLEVAMERQARRKHQNGQPDGPANGSQPFSSETRQT